MTLFLEHIVVPMFFKNGRIFPQLLTIWNAFPFISFVNIQLLYHSPNSQRFIHYIELQSHPFFLLLCKEKDNISAVFATPQPWGNINISIIDFLNWLFPALCSRALCIIGGMTDKSTLIANWKAEYIKSIAHISSLFSVQALEMWCSSAVVHAV